MNANDPEQLELNLDAPADNNNPNGYDIWHAANQQRIAQIAETWHLPLYRKVRVKLTGLPDELQGTLILREIPEELNTRTRLLLRVDGVNFCNSQIEYCNRCN
jgi:hypothetical protein